MACVVCNGSTGAGAVTVRVPLRLAGQQACDICGPPLEMLANGELTEGAMEALVAYLSGLGNEKVATDVRRAWEQKAYPASRNGISDIDAAAAMSGIITTSGFSFDGYKIIAYFGFYSEEVVLGMGLFRGITSDFANIFGAESGGLRDRLAEAKGTAFTRLKYTVAGTGGNAIIGIDLDYTMFGDALVGVIASGTSVFIEPV